LPLHPLGELLGDGRIKLHGEYVKTYNVKSRYLEYN
jgi:hypothetical protein